MLGRAADPSGLATYQGVLASGGSLADVGTDLSQSAEGQARTAALHPAAVATAPAAAVVPDPGMLQVAANLLLAVQLAQRAGNADQVQLASTAYQLATKIADLPPAARGGPSWGMSASVKDHDGHTVDVIVYDDTSGACGPTGHVIYHDKPNDPILGTVEQVVGLVADVLSFVPGVDAVAIPVAIAVSAAEGGQDLASGNILGGVLAIAGAAAGGVGAWASGAVDSAVSGVADAASAGSLAGVQAASDALASAQDVLGAAQAVSRGVAAAQGVAGVVQAAQDGDALAALTSAAGGLAGSAYAGTNTGVGLQVASALTGAGVAAAGGNVLSALAAAGTAAAGAGAFNGTGAAPSAPDPATDNSQAAQNQAAQNQGVQASAAPASDVAQPPAGGQGMAAAPAQQASSPSPDAPLLMPPIPPPNGPATLDALSQSASSPAAGSQQQAPAAPGSDADPAQGTQASGQPAAPPATPSPGLIAGVVATAAVVPLGGAAGGSAGSVLAPLADAASTAAPAIALPLALSGDTPVDPNAPVRATVAGRSDLSAYVSSDTVSVNKLAPALGGLMSTVTGSTTLKLDLSDGVPGYANLTDAQGNVVGVLQGSQITLVNGGIPALDGNIITTPAPMLAAPSTGGGATTATPTPPSVPSSPPPTVPAAPLPTQAGTTASPGASTPTVVSTPIPDSPAAPSVMPGAPTDGVQQPTILQSQGDPGLTQPTGPINGVPSGQRSTSAAEATSIQKAQIDSENQVADMLAIAGYQTVQSPTQGANPVVTPERMQAEGLNPDKNPDLLVEGRIYDTYTPVQDSTGSIVNGIKSKIVDEQTQRVVVDLRDTTQTTSSLRAALRVNPIPGLKEVITVTANGLSQPFRP